MEELLNYVYEHHSKTCPNHATLERIPEHKHFYKKKKYVYKSRIYSSVADFTSLNISP